MVGLIIPANLAAGGYYELCYVLISAAHMQKRFALTADEIKKSAEKIGSSIKYLYENYGQGITHLKNTYKVDAPELLFKSSIEKLTEGKPDEALDEIKKARENIMEKIKSLPIMPLWEGLEDFLPK